MLYISDYFARVDCFRADYDNQYWPAYTLSMSHHSPVYLHVHIHIQPLAGIDDNTLANTPHWLPCCDTASGCGLGHHMITRPGYQDPFSHLIFFLLFFSFPFSSSRFFELTDRWPHWGSRFEKSGVNKSS